MTCTNTQQTVKASIKVIWFDEIKNSTFFQNSITQDYQVSQFLVIVKMCNFS